MRPINRGNPPVDADFIYYFDGATWYVYSKVLGDSFNPVSCILNNR